MIWGPATTRVAYVHCESRPAQYQDSGQRVSVAKDRAALRSDY